MPPTHRLRKETLPLIYARWLPPECLAESSRTRRFHSHRVLIVGLLTASSGRPQIFPCTRLFIHDPRCDSSDDCGRALLDNNDVADEAVLEGGYTRVVQQVFRFALPTTKHVFLAGHRIMVQVQSSWFPLYDRNPQNYVENIFFAKPGDYKKATIKIFDGGSAVSFVDCRWCSRPPITALETKAAE